MKKIVNKATEVDAYEYISKELSLLNWIVKNPLRNNDGEVYKQNECLSNKDIKECLILDRPEAIVILKDSSLWILESKRERERR